MKIYVASSWRNEYQPMVVEILRSNENFIKSKKIGMGDYFEDNESEAS